MAITRRHLLAASAGIAAAAAVCAGGIGIRWWDAPPGAGRVNLSDDEAALVRALSGAAFPAGKFIELSGGDVNLDRFFDAMLSGMPKLTGDLLKLLTNALEHFTLATHGTRYSVLSLADQQAQLDGWLTSDRHELRGAVQSVVILLGMGYTTHPEVAALISPWHGCGYGR
ncbi:MAG: hypothetical protein ACI8RZ_006284 [Myxococcota bacterium]|jgi:hypothetical protein